MNKYNFYIFINKKAGKACRLIFRIEDNGKENFHSAESTLSENKRLRMGLAEAESFIKSNNLKLIDTFTSKI